MAKRIKKKSITKDMLKKESFYLQARLLNRTRIRDTRLKASKKMADMAITSGQKAVRGDRPVILTTIWAPSEILYALDIIPINVETTAASLANLGLGDEILAIAEREFHSPETCSILRCAMGAAIDKIFPEPSAVIATTHLCDAGAKMISSASQVYDCPYFLIDIPQERGEEALSYVAKQLEEMTLDLAELTGQRLNREKLAQAIQTSNRTREYAIQANELRRTVPSPMRGSEAIGYLYVLGVGFGSQEALSIYRTLARELKKRVSKGFMPLGEERYRLLWLHIKPYYRNRLFHYLEKDRKASIAFDELSYIFWPELDPEQPFRSVAQKLVLNVGNEPIGTYIDILLRTTEEYQIDGVLHFAHWGCRWNYGRTKIVKEAFQKKGIPFISIDGDGASKQNYFEGQVNSQIDSFLDMMD